ncbi:hypothetical protein [Streptomyces adustus]|uniref:hypothetical protein n=1 Tax=Streptomyces adustus TaxID=1609272 RepID=UPI00192E5BC2|nr:hypothetical protein [Streptomyces adustus]
MINYSLTELRTAGGSNSATLRQPALSPVVRLLGLGAPLPNLPVRASAADAFTEVLLTDFTAGYCEVQLRALLPGSSSLPRSLDLGYVRNHNHTAIQCLLRLA